MIYLELQLCGIVRVYDLSDRLVLLRATIEARAECLPIPETMEDAHAYLRSRCYQFEMFEDLAEAEAWAEDYHGFRSGEVRAELRRFRARATEYAGIALDIIAA